MSGLADLPLVLVVNKDVPGENVTEFIAYAKANPSKVAFASFGARTISHLAIELLKTSSGIEFVHVPYPGGPQIITDMVSGRDAGRDGRAAELAAAYPRPARCARSRSCRRSAIPAIPDVPAISETIPGLEINAGTGIGVPAATPAEIVARLNRDINASLADPALKSRYADVGAVPIIFTPAEARAKIAGDIEKWRKVIETPALSRNDRGRAPQPGALALIR